MLKPSRKHGICDVYRPNGIQLYSDLIYFRFLMAVFDTQRDLQASQHLVSVESRLRFNGNFCVIELFCSNFLDTQEWLLCELNHSRN